MSTGVALLDSIPSRHLSKHLLEAGGGVKSIVGETPHGVGRRDELVSQVIKSHRYSDQPIDFSRVGGFPQHHFTQNKILVHFPVTKRSIFQSNRKPNLHNFAARLKLINQKNQRSQHFIIRNYKPNGRLHRSYQ